MVLRNGISLGIRKKHIRIGNKFDCVEGVRDSSHPRFLTDNNVELSDKAHNETVFSLGELRIQ